MASLAQNLLHRDGMGNFGRKGPTPMTTTRLDPFGRLAQTAPQAVTRLDPFGRLPRTTPNRPAKPPKPSPRPYDKRTRVAKSDPRAEEDSAYRAAWGTEGRRPYGTGMRAAFYEFLPAAPKHSRPDVDGCKNYVRQITETLERECWSQKERDRLKTLRKIWTRRVDGLDSRYLTHGNLGGHNNVTDVRGARPGSARAVFDAIQAEIAESDARYYANAGVKVARPASRRQKIITDAKWPLGRWNPDYRA